MDTPWGRESSGEAWNGSAMDEHYIENVRASFKVVAFRGEELAEQFFTRLFQAQPGLRGMFPGDAWQRDRDVLTGLGTLVKNLHRVEAIGYVLEDAGIRCQRAGAQPHHFGVARDAMLASLKDMLGVKWDAELEAGWTEALNVALSMMIRGGGRARLRAA
jgi:hemoglobin-like flavoprotein